MPGLGLRLVLMMIGAGLTAACAETPAPNSAFGTAAPTVSASAPDAILERLGALPPQTLKSGECGLFLWAKLPSQNLVLFQKTGDASALINFDGRQTFAQQSRASGVALYGISPQQSFLTADGRTAITLKLTIDADPGIQGGAVVNRGTLKLADQSAPDGSGWQAVISVAGLVGCQTAEAS